ncbi:hypothetical protein Tco_1323113 [Tanacetum coccineum]
MTSPATFSAATTTIKHHHIPPNSLTYTNPKPNPHRLTITMTTAMSSDSTTIINKLKPQPSEEDETW